MRTLLSIWLATWTLLGSLLPGVGIEESAELNQLVKHFQDHRQTEKDLNFCDFLWMHYRADSEHHKHPNHSHQHLPSALHSLLVTPPNFNSFVYSLPILVTLMEPSQSWIVNDLYCFEIIQALIHPPR